VEQQNQEHIKRGLPFSSVLRPFVRKVTSCVRLPACVYTLICIPMHTTTFISAFTAAYISTYLSFSVYLSISLIHLYVHFFDSLSMFLCIYAYISIYIYSFHLVMYLPIFLSFPFFQNFVLPSRFHCLFLSVFFNCYLFSYHYRRDS
jgi:hypothetical protein